MFLNKSDDVLCFFINKYFAQYRFGRLDDGLFVVFRLNHYKVTQFYIQVFAVYRHVSTANGIDAVNSGVNGLSSVQNYHAALNPF